MFLMMFDEEYAEQPAAEFLSKINNKMETKVLSCSSMQIIWVLWPKYILKMRRGRLVV